MSTNKLKITLCKSLIGASPKQRRTVKALGLRKLHQTLLKEDTPSIRGMVNRVPFLLNVEHSQGEENE